MRPETHPRPEFRFHVDFLREAEMPRTPSGTVTFLFTDIEGSTRRWEDDTVETSRLLAQHDRLLTSAIDSNNGYVLISWIVPS